MSVSINKNILKINTEISDLNLIDHFKSIEASTVDDELLRLLKIGLQVSKNEKFAQFLDETEEKFREEHPHIFKMFEQVEGEMEVIREERKKSAKGGLDLEDEILNHLISSSPSLGEFEKVGTKGNKSKNKTGDILVTFEDQSQTIIEIKYAAGFKVGELYVKEKADNAITQIMEAKREYDCRYGILAYDISKPLKDAGESAIIYQPGIGFIVQVDRENNNYNYLEIALSIIQQLNSHEAKPDIEAKYINSFCRVLEKDLKYFDDIASSSSRLKKEVEKIETTIEKLKESFAVNQKHLSQYINGQITSEDVLEYLGK